jgi:Uncharacterized enzyme involved in biosynthesis of extracellular polysaccharides
MIVRIVHLHIKKDQLTAFIAFFETKRALIFRQPGCLFLSMLQGAEDEQAVTTYSHWENVEALNNYRHSPLFGEIWPYTKSVMDQPPVAQSFYQRTTNDQ